MAPAKRKATDTSVSPTRRSTRISNNRAKMTTEKCDAEIEIKHRKGLHQVAASPQRKSNATSAPTRSSARLSNKRTKMITAKLDAEVEIKHQKETGRTWAPRVQVPHDCKEKLEELTRLLDLKTVGSTVDFLLPTIEGAKEIAELSRELGHDTGGKTIDWLLQEAEPVIAAARVGRQDPPTVIAGYSPIHAPPFRTPQFSQNPQFTFTSTGFSAWYSSNLYPPAFTPTTVQSSTGRMTTHLSDLPFPSTYFNGFPGKPTSRASAPNSANHMSSGHPNAMDINKHVRAPADHIPMESTIQGHDTNQLFHSEFNGGHSSSVQFRIPMTGREIDAGVQNKSQSLLNRGPFAEFNKTNHLQEHENPVQQIQSTEFVNSQIET